MNTSAPATKTGAKGAEQAGGPTSWQTVANIVFPTDADTDTLPLFVDFNAQRHSSVKSLRPAEASGPEPVEEQQAAAGSGQSAQLHSELLSGDRSIHVPAHTRISLGTYFNAFPASYWRAHTSVDTVRLTAQTTSPAKILVYRSSARGTSNRVVTLEMDGAEQHTDLPLTSFGDGGWYWIDIVTAGSAVDLVHAEWSVPLPEDMVPGTASVAITTFNRPDFCVRNLKILGESDALRDAVDRFILTDQGNQRVRDEAGYDEVRDVLGDRLQLIEQGNLGGSGGFARGMYEASREGGSRYVMLLDDDVEVHPESILRAVRFGDYARHNTIVGGHMFNLYEKSVIHSFGERVNEYRFMWGSAEGVQEAHDFAGSNLRTTPWMHRRIDVDYNGWWMCLIPTDLVREIGLSLPVFIKWDDAEFGLRAKQAGYSTVSLPGVAVWHMPWTEKDDTIDWQAYYHARNRWLAALLYSPYSKGGDLPKESLLTDVRHLISMQYSAAELRAMAIEDLLEGPEHLHRTIGTKLAEVRATRNSFTDARVQKDLSQFPPVRRSKPLPHGEEPHPPTSRVGRAAKLLSGAVHQVVPVKAEESEHPESRVPAMNLQWWRMAKLDSALVSSADGSGASWYKRDNPTFKRMMKRSVALHRKLYKDWDKLAEQYRRALPEFTSPEAWAETFEANGPQN
ncbi:glycosyltransferase [Kocuria rhizophila]|uniref:glycosyltransferase n=1 Tax=Kocuria rhizophila TaxID=72000 RepID=UPI0021A94C06|nr:glycosyltransferase [Kocuria rhizophila]MCT1457700.1 glycosyltransferase [Kocuria rhizophila]WSQ04809.1 glycosyltransferase [Kocuria rhizophila]